MFFGPLFQPVKIVLSLDSAILSITNPSGFVSSANLISTSSVLVHPCCREKGGGRQGHGLCLLGCGSCQPADSGGPSLPPRCLCHQTGNTWPSYSGHRGFVEGISWIAPPCPWWQAPPCPSCSSYPLGPESRRAHSSRELLLAPKDALYILLSTALYLRICRRLLSNLPACPYWDLMFCSPSQDVGC